MQFDETFFATRNYTFKQNLVKRHVLEVVKWASKASKRNLSEGRGKTALDVGCAMGYSSNVLETLGYETCGVDISTWGVAQAKKNNRGEFLVCDAQSSLPFNDGTFDLVTCFDVLEHLSLPENALRNILRTCRGVLVCTTPNKSVEKPVRRITRDYDESHISAKNVSEWRKTLRRDVDCDLVRVDTFFDLTAKLGNSKLIFKSFQVPKFGLTVRILVRK